MFRVVVVAGVLLSLAAVAEAKPVWRHYPSVIPVVAFAYVGPGNTVWRVWRPRVTKAPAAVETAPPVAAEPATVAAEPVAVPAPLPVAPIAETAPPRQPAPIAAKPAEPLPVVAPVPKPSAPAAVAVAEPEAAPPSYWDPRLQILIAAAVVAVFAVGIFLFGRRRGAVPGS